MSRISFEEFVTMHERFDNMEERESQRQNAFDLQLEEEGKEDICDAALCQVSFEKDNQIFQMIEGRASANSDLARILRETRNDPDAQTFILEHEELWDEPVERKPKLNKNGCFVRSKPSENEWVGKIVTTTDERMSTRGPRWIKIDTLVTWPCMGALPRISIQQLCNDMRNNVVYGNLYEFINWLEEDTIICVYLPGNTIMNPKVHEGYKLSTREKNILWMSYKLGRACWAARNIVKFLRFACQIEDPRIVLWKDKVVDAIRTGKVKDGCWLYNHINDVRGRCPQDKLACFEANVRVVWQCWGERKACFSIAKFLYSI